MSRQRAREVWKWAGLALPLCWTGGYVDGVGYLVLARLFTSHMSGNTVASGVGIGTGDWHTAFHRGFPIPMFFLGVLFGAFLGEVLARGGVRSRRAVAHAVEALLLAVFMTVSARLLRDGLLTTDDPWLYYSLAALPALAMGLQNATLRRAAGLSVWTTFITGSLASCAELFVGYGFWLRDHAIGPRKRPLVLLLRLSPRQDSLVKASFLLLVWTCYIGGGITGAWAHGRWPLYCLAVPLGFLAALSVRDLIRPFPGREPRAR